MKHSRLALSLGLASSLAVGTLAFGTPSVGAAGPTTGGWSALGSGIGDGRVFQAAQGPDGLYVGGTFTSAGGVSGTRNIARWTGSAWEALGSGVTNSGPNSPNGGVFAVAVAETPPPRDVRGAGPTTHVWIGGDFSQVSGESRSRLARWEVGTGWISAPRAEDTPYQWDGVEEIVPVSTHEVYIGGAFAVSGTAAASHIAVFDGTALQPLGGGVGPANDGPYVNGLTRGRDGNIIATGQFTRLDATTSPTNTRRVATWKRTTSTWETLSDANSGPDALVAAVADTTAGVVIGGTFGTVTNSGTDVADTDHLAMWNGTSWVSIGTVDGPVVEELRVIGDYLYAGGEFTSIGGVEATNIARVRISTLSTSPVWEPLRHACHEGVDGVVRTIVDAGDGAIYVGGGFTAAGDVPGADRIAKYSPGAPGCADDVLPAPTNFRMIGVTRDVVGGTSGSRAHFAWDAPADAGFTSFRITTRGRRTPTGYDDTVRHPDLTCRTRATSCSIFFPFTREDDDMRGRRFQQVTYSLRGVGPDGAGRAATLGPLYLTPLEPPSAPRDVTVTTGWNYVDVSWKAPEEKGSAGFVTNYLVQADPGGRVCINRITEVPETRADRTCRFTRLRPGTQYTFRVQALSYFGWGPRSQPTEVAVSPQVLSITSTKRVGPSLTLLGGTRVVVEGAAPGYEPGTKIQPSVRIGTGRWQTEDVVRVSRSGEFRFERRVGLSLNRQPVEVKFQLADRSGCTGDADCGRTETVVIPAKR